MEKKENYEVNSELESIKTKRLERNLVAQGTILNYYHDKVQIPGGKVVQYDFIGHQGAAAVVPVTEDGKLLMVRQYRNALDRFTLEIPAGGLDGPEEPTMQAALRELEEETGYRAEKISFLLSLYPTVAYCNEKIDVYLATGLTKTAQHLDEDEFLNVEAWDVNDLLPMIFEGRIQDAKTICSVLAYAAKMKQ
ncbi:MAG: NUDIX hydrolase [Lachnospiraceae bacterium]|nr:NUDIX hydrolase [Lachnospiraceae bacterium]